MASLPCSWASYARFQTRLLNSSRLDDRAWGLESALNVILEPDFSAELTGDEEFRRAAASGSRKRREHLSRFLVTSDNEFDPPDGRDTLAQIVARQALHAIEDGLERLQDQHLLSAIADGDGYEQVARVLGRPESSLRSRMLRLRSRFAHLRP